MVGFNINEIRSEMAYGGARPAYFMLNLTNPINPIADTKLSFMARATALPEWEVGVVEVPYFGRTIKLSGARRMGEWNVTVMNDEDYLARNALEQWSNAMNSLEGNLNTTGSASPLNYKSQGTVTSYGKTGNILRVYQFKGIWPSSISGMDVDWTQGDAIMEFQVTFQYDDFEVVGGITGNAGGI